MFNTNSHHPDVDGLPLAALRNRKSFKWRGFPADVLPLPVAEMDFEIAKPIRDELIGMLEVSDTGYLGPIPELGTNLAAFALARWNWKVDPEQIFTATDVGVGMVEMGRTVVKPGDLIMYKEFDFEDLRTRMVRIMKKEPRYQVEWARIIDMDPQVFDYFMNRTRKTMHAKNATKFENYIESKEKELGIT